MGVKATKAEANKERQKKVRLKSSILSQNALEGRGVISHRRGKGMQIRKIYRTSMEV